ncbi:GNAT family N-acetyltransferase [Amycolatopsis sp. NPDC059021]|uniref:GNAT family N-acetyltransferase n=1 Tax=Amycolatopsis sp. NPDC059021 TaxID=3346704 RepID=UPI00366E6841
MDHVVVRPMAVADLARAERTSSETFYVADQLSRRVSEPEPQPRDAAGAEKWIARMRYYLDVDPAGCWVAEDDGAIVGFAISQNRGRFWYLATYGVLPDRQGGGIGKRLMDAVLAYADGRQGMFSSTVHPGATRRYRLAGFTLHPQLRMVGTVDRSTLPAIGGLRDGTADDFAWMDRLDTKLRGAGHGPDHGYLLNTMRLVVAKSENRRGYVYIDDAGRAALLAAEDTETASDLLWEALASAKGETLVNCITAANHWAVDVGLAARLDIGQEGYLAVRGMADPRPYLASGQFL